MANKGVEIPIDLTIKDIQLGNIKTGKVEKSVTQALAGVSKKANDILGSIDTSKFNKELAKSADTVTKKFTNVNKVYADFNNRLQSAGMSSTVYKKAIKKAEEELELYTKQWKSTEKYYKDLAEYKTAQKKLNAGADISDLTYKERIAVEFLADAYKTYQSQVDAVNKSRPDPSEFIRSADVRELQKLVDVYQKFYAVLGDATSALKDFGDVKSENLASDEFKSGLGTLDALGKKVDAISAKYAKMQALGATDSAFKSIKYDADQLDSKIKEIVESMTTMVSEGKAFRFDPTTDSNEVADATEKYEEQIKVVSNLEIQLNELSKTQALYSEDIATNEQAIQSLKAQIANVEALRAKYEQAYAAQNKVVKSARQNVRSQVTAEGTANATAEYDKQKQKLNDIKNAIAQCNAKIAEYNSDIQGSTGYIASMKSEFNENVVTIGKVKSELASAKQLLTQLASAKDKAENTANTKAQESLIAQIEAKLSSISPKLDDIANSTDNIKGKANQASKSVASIANGFTKAVNGIKKRIASIISSFDKLTKSSRSSSDSIGKNFKRILRTIMQVSFGVRTLFFLIRKLRSAFISSFQEMATQIPEVNQSISSFLTALNQLKGTIAAAFQPIASVVIPYLNQLIAALSSAMEALGRFFATLTGQGYIYKFTAKNVDYAASQASKSADKLKKSLMGFDEINRLDDKDSGSSGGGADSTGTWEKETLDSANKLAEMIKQAWASGGEFYDVGQYLGQQLLGALEVADNWITTNGYAYAEKIGKSLGTLLTGFVETEGLGTQIGKTIADALNMAMIGLDTFLTTTNWLSVGQFIADWANASVSNFKWDLLGKTVADAITAAVNMWWQFVGEFNFEGLGEKIALAINTFLSTMSISDETGLTVWQKVGESISRTVHGLLTTITTAIEQVNWIEVGRGIGQMISSIDWGQIAWDFTKLVLAIVKAIAETIMGWAETDPISASIAAMVGLAVIGADIAPVISSALPLVSKLGETFQIVAGGAGTLKEALELAFGVVGTAIGGIVLTVGGALTAIFNFFSMLTDGFTWLKEIFMVIGIAVAAVGAVILGVPATVAAVVAGVIAVVATLIVAIKENWNAIVTFFQNAWSAFTTTLSTFCTGVANTVKDILNTIKQTITDIVNGIKQFISDALNWIKQFVSDIINAISTTVSNIMTTIKNTISTVINTIKSVISTVLNTIKSIWTTIWTTIKTTTNTVFTNIKSVITTAVTTIKNGISTGLNAIKSTWTNIWNSVKSTTTSIFDGMVSAIKKAINSIIGAVNGMIKGIVNGINSAISALNSISFDIPDWIPELGGMSFGLNIPKISAPSIPYLAQGAVIPPNKEFLAMLGDQKSGTNIEAPLDTIKQAVAEELAEQIDAMMEGFEAVVNAINNKDMTVAIGDKEIGQANARYSRRQNLVRGVSSV